MQQKVSRPGRWRNNNKFKLLITYQNVRGLRSKLDSVRLFNLLHVKEVIAMSETWLNHDVYDRELGFVNHVLYRKDRSVLTSTKSRGGGVLLAVPNSLKSYSINLPFNNVEQIFTRINCGSYKVIIGVVYIPPNSDCNLYSTHFDTLEFIRNKFPVDQLCIMGDFNLPEINWIEFNSNFHSNNIDFDFSVNNYSSKAISLLNVCSLLNLFQSNLIYNHQNKTLDLVLSNFSNIEVLHNSDQIVKPDLFHPPLEIIVSLTRVKLIDRDKPYKDFRNGDYEKINISLHNTDWSFLSYGSLESRVVEFYNIFYKIIDEFVPTKKPSSLGFPSWFSNQLIVSIFDKKIKHKKFKETGSLSDYDLFNSARKNCKLLIKNDHKSYISNIQAALKNNSKSFWSYINSLKNSNCLPNSLYYGMRFADSPDNISKLFADYFGEIYTNTTSSFNCHPLNPLNYIDINNISFSADVICKQIKELKPKFTSGPDNIPPIFLKQCCSSISTPLSILFNRSLAEGTFPSPWKCSFVLPIHKNGDKHNVANYRGICIQSAIPKLFEKLIYSTISPSISKIIDQRQHGFMKGRSTLTNLAIHNKNIMEAFDNDLQMDVVYTDISKAFDKVNLDLLIFKLSCYGFENSLFEWFKSYLLGRSSIVNINGFFSEMFFTTCGVPQGSHLGPIMFLLFFNDVFNVFDDVVVSVFADDLKISKAITCPGDCSILQRNVDNFCDWCCSNNLTINSNKCSIISFSRSDNFINHQYLIGGFPLTRVNEISDLGVLMDRRLDFSHHILSLTLKASKLLGFLCRSVKSFNDVHTIRLLYLSLVRSNLEYCSQIWSPFYVHYIELIEKIQNKFAKFLCLKFNIQDQTRQEVLKSLNLNFLDDRRDLLDLTFLYRLVNGGYDCPELVGDILLAVPLRQLRRHNLFYCGRSTTNYISNYWLNRLPATANRLNLDLFEFQSIYGFKRLALERISN